MRNGRCEREREVETGGERRREERRGGANGGKVSKVSNRFLRRKQNSEDERTVDVSLRANEQGSQPAIHFEYVARTLLTMKVCPQSLQSSRPFFFLVSLRGEGSVRVSSQFQLVVDMMARLEMHGTKAAASAPSSDTPLRCLDCHPPAHERGSVRPAQQSTRVLPARSLLMSRRGSRRTACR